MRLRDSENKAVIPTAFIKSKRNKVVQAIHRESSLHYVVKTMVFRNHQEFLLFQKDFGDRLDVLKRIKGLGLLQIIQRELYWVQVKEEKNQWTVYIMQREVIGPTLMKVLENESLVFHILMGKNIKDLIWNIFASMIAGGGFPTLIVTLQNLIFEEIGDKYRPVLNYFSFNATRLLTLRKDIEKEEFKEIAMFLDEQALESGNLDRFQFKCRNFAILVLSLLLRHNPNVFIFHHVDLPSSISIEKAKQVYKSVVKPRIKEMLGFQPLKQTFKFLNIPGLEEFIHSALASEGQPAQDWSTLQKILLQEGKDKSGVEGKEQRIARILWENQAEQAKKMLEKRGLGLGKNGARIYLAFRLSVHLQCLLQFNDWKGMMKKLSYNYKTHELFYRLLQCTTVGEQPVLEQATRELLSISKESFKMMGVIENRNVVTSAYQSKIIYDYAQLLDL